MTILDEMRQALKAENRVKSDIIVRRRVIRMLKRTIKECLEKADKVSKHRQRSADGWMDHCAWIEVQMRLNEMLCHFEGVVSNDHS